MKDLQELSVPEMCMALPLVVKVRTILKLQSASSCILRSGCPWSAFLSVTYVKPVWLALLKLNILLVDLCSQRSLSLHFCPFTTQQALNVLHFYPPLRSECGLLLCPVHSAEPHGDPSLPSKCIQPSWPSHAYCCPALAAKGECEKYNATALVADSGTS